MKEKTGESKNKTVTGCWIDGKNMRAVKALKKDNYCWADEKDNYWLWSRWREQISDVKPTIKTITDLESRGRRRRIPVYKEQIKWN